MAIMYACSMDHYGEAATTAYWASDATGGWALDNDIMLGDGWANEPTFFAQAEPDSFLKATGEYSISTPPWGARRGDYALVANAPAVKAQKVYNSSFSGLSMGDDAAWMLTIPGASAATRTVHVAFGIDSLPTIDKLHGRIIDFYDGSGQRHCGLTVTPSGRLELVNGDTTTLTPISYTGLPTALVTSNAPVIAANTWYSLSMTITVNGDGTVDFDLYVGEITAANKVLTGTSLPSTGSGNITTLGLLPASGAGSGSTAGPGFDDANIRAVRDIVLSDATGTYNTGPLGQVFVSAEEVRAEDTGGGWAPQSRENVSTGILDSVTTSTGIYFLDHADFDLGSNDFTLETFLRFDELPTAASADIIAKWGASGNRAWRLYYNGTTGTLNFDISTDGATTTTVKAVPWDVEKWHWYHVAVSRWTDGGGTYTSLFVDGVEIGVPTSDTNTYYNDISAVGIGARFAGTASVPVLKTTSLFAGYMDETRITNGTGRYTADFTVPTAKFGRDGGSDTAWANVVLLLGYEEVIADDSTSAHTPGLDGTSPLTVASPDDGDYTYSVLNQRPAWDDTFVEATNYFAQSILTLDINPTASETITIGTQTYTMVSSFSGSPADEVLIGATVSDTLDHLTAAINGGTGEGTVYGTGTVANTDAIAVAYLSPQLIVRSVSAGASTVATTETLANGAFDGATLSGGTDIPADSDFSLERLGIDVTGVLGVQVTARVAKSDAGSTSMRFDLVGPSAGVAAGTAFAPDLNAAWQRQVFEEDPDTSASITPSTLIGGRLRFKRVT